MKYYILFGPPGAGKGTQAGAIAERYNLRHVSTGELLRAEIAAGTKLGNHAKALIEAGELVPDYVVEGMIEHLFSATKNFAGFLLDGFPRTLDQAIDLDKILSDRGEQVNAVISMMISDDTIRERLAHRAEVEGRADDSSMETINNRIATYHKRTEPLIEYYKAADKYYEVCADGKTIDEVREDVIDLFHGSDKSMLGKHTVIDNKLLDTLQKQAHDSPRLRMNYDLRNSEEDKSQRMLNVFWPGCRIEPHRHRNSNETIIIIRGMMDIVLYDDSGVEIERIHMGGNTGLYGLNITKGAWHAVEAYELAFVFTAKEGEWTPNAKEDILEIKKEV